MHKQKKKFQTQRLCSRAPLWFSICILMREIKAPTSKQSIKAGILKLCFCHLSYFFFILLVLVLAERDLEDQQDNVVKGDRGQMLPAGLWFETEALRVSMSQSSDQVGEMTGHIHQQGCNIKAWPHREQKIRREALEEKVKAISAFHSMF